jgi:hypothetical protein
VRPIVIFALGEISPEMVRLREALSPKLSSMKKGGFPAQPVLLWELKITQAPGDDLAMERSLPASMETSHSTRTAKTLRACVKGRADRL